MRELIPALLLVAVFTASGIALGESDHQHSRRLVEAGEILPLQQILDRIGQQGSRLLEVELERDEDHYLYEIELLDSEGRVWEYEIDASSGEIIERELGE